MSHRTSMDPSLDSPKGKRATTSDAPDLFSQPVSTGITFPAPSVPSATSENAADALTHTAKGRARRETQLVRILRLIASRESGFTMPEIEAATGLRSGTICARVVWDLVPKKYVEKSIVDGKELTRRLGEGGPAAVYFATPAGRARLAAIEKAA